MYARELDALGWRLVVARPRNEKLVIGVGRLVGLADDGLYLTKHLYLYPPNS